MEMEKLIKNLAAHSNLNRVNRQKSGARDTQTKRDRKGLSEGLDAGVFFLKELNLQNSFLIAHFLL